MKKRILVILGLLAGFLAVAGIAYAVYSIISVTGEVTVDEAITVVPMSFTATMYPAETVTETLTLSNAGSIAIEVDFIYTVVPTDPEISVSGPTKITVPATGSITADVDVDATKSAAPASYSISVEITR